MNGLRIDDALNKWFDMKVPVATVAPDYIEKALNEPEYIAGKPLAKVVWLGNPPHIEFFTKTKKGNSWEMASLTFQSKKATLNIKVGQHEGKWLCAMLQKLSFYESKIYTLQEVHQSYEQEGLEDFALFWDNKPVNTLYKMGLLVL
jgi:hypothetical protein